jgi:hypothetical protein
MRTRKRFASIGLCLVAVLLVLTASAAADGGGAIHYWGDQVLDLTTLPDGTPIGPGTASVEPLPGGRLYLEWLGGSQYAADPEETPMDLISGKWYFEIYGIQQPSGVMTLWASIASYQLDHFDGLGCDEGGGGWNGTFQGVILANGDLMGNGTNEGCGALEGWRMKHQEVWKGLDPDAGVYASRTFSGHFKPASP